MSVICHCTSEKYAESRAREVWEQTIKPGDVLRGDLVVAQPGVITKVGIPHPTVINVIREKEENKQTLPRIFLHLKRLGPNYRKC